jgi:hypothetical protein
VTVTRTCVWWEVEPLVPVTVTVYVRSCVKGVVVTVRVDWPEPPGDRETLVGFRVVVTVGSLGFTEPDSWTVPEKPVLRRVMVDDPELPAETKKDVGDALIEKSEAA